MLDVVRRNTCRTSLYCVFLRKYDFKKSVIIIKSHFCPPFFAKAGDIKIHSSVCPSIPPSVCYKNFNLAHIFCGINDKALIFGMHDYCDKLYLLVPCCDLQLGIIAYIVSKIMNNLYTKIHAFIKK